MLGDMKLVEDDLAVGVRKVLAGGLDVRIPHVHRHAAHRRSLLLRNAPPEPVQAFLGPVLGYKQHPAPIQIIDHGEVVVPFGKRLLIDPEPLDGFRLTARQAALDSPLLNGMHLIPTQPQLIADRLLTGRLEPVDGQSFKQRREPAGGLGPSKLYRPSAMFSAVAARRFRMQDRLILTGVQMPPAALRLMVVERARLAALRTRALDSLFVHQMNVNFPIRHLQLNVVHSPGGSNPQNLVIQSVILHLPIMNSPTQIPDEPNKEAGDLEAAQGRSGLISTATGSI